ncbi:MAG: cobalamin biosynthesis protein [Hamadaea sp.]|uniref:cobalamin biosynthesis protein n=1 Tax=Hamadaea sp. TaxID=2024425 RepID=UPI001848271A|nr:cobalamin biosynthesis protein [Hamadaea sp.]NUR73947.1 cobalamin biosynthesis protein [Hamadaea sp.]NUT21903.1 cobalamin biosynthesis protein [Hamadaea sp.]
MREVDAAGMAAGYALDALLGDPRRFHPVAGYGKAAGTVERLLYAPSRADGAIFTAVAVGAPVLAAIAANRLTRYRPFARFALVTATTWAVLGGRSLRREAAAMADSLEAGDTEVARERITHLCGRDPAALDESDLARATVESVAENTSDAVVAPLVWGAVAGLPGLVGYRAVNTLDAMVGHKSQRYADFGTASAKLDDAANLIPSRLTAMLTALAAPVVGGGTRGTWQVWRRDGGKHPSPNSGQCEAAFAGALDVTLGGENVYFGRTEVRPSLGDGGKPVAADARRAAKLSGVVGLAALGVAVATRLARRSR